MRFLHTSDWHLGKTILGRKRHEVQQAFLNWLIEQIRLLQIDVLLVAGDVFDNAHPDIESQKQYYRFLFEAAQTNCQHIIIVGGNHDSPLFLEAPQELLRLIDVKVVGQACADPEDEVIALENETGLSAIVCAVPFLRDRDLRKSSEDESLTDKNAKLIEGIQKHYLAVAAAAEKLRGDRDIPIVATGHLFTAGGRSVADDGVRDLYVGSLVHIPAHLFADSFDYLALGHLHQFQHITDRIVYCGSPLPMGFQEAKTKKQLTVAAFCGRQPVLSSIPVPVFDHLETVTGDSPAIVARLKELISLNRPVKVEVWYNADSLASALRADIEEVTRGTQVDVCRVRSLDTAKPSLLTEKSFEILAELDEFEVFEQRLAQTTLPPQEQAILRRIYREIVDQIYLRGGSEDENHQAAL